jgi:hypothetical protein
MPANRTASEKHARSVFIREGIVQGHGAKSANRLSSATYNEGIKTGSHNRGTKKKASESNQRP